ncbi:MAG: filamentous hemagglutinin N-terminal domain-containing protein [Rhodospirillales bacterium]|nr:filamentous hemagglutinin N-terminal domain-containing protein [Rhodospirillales bacterium]
MPTAGHAVCLRGTVRRRQALLLGTALQALGVLILPGSFRSARAQPAANARPAGGVVVAGSASISSTPDATAIDQSTQRAAIDWRSFDVGARQSVDFHQPSASAVTLNRVTGANPSRIAGRITANGQVILQNQDGITFYKGAQVNTAGFVATAAGITNRNFMAGHMVFDQPAAPGARVVNQGRITVRQAGIAALVAPQVANSGVITAKLGQVVLAGAKTYALDLYGDGLVSIDVNGEVKQVPVGPDGRKATALVTNTGTIVAAGGVIELTARAAAGVVQNLVTAGGTIAAPTVGARGGEIVLNGVGGSLVVAGQLLAQGAAPGEHGGQIEIAPDGGVSVAAAARIDASGAAGGGTIAVGTDLARAAGGPAVTPAMLSHDVAVARGATIAADATGSGTGGRITVLSAASTVMHGAISAHGGPDGGNGGFAEVSGRTLGFDGSVDLGAPVGNVGTILFDPGTLDVINAGSGVGSLDASAGTILSNVGTTYDTVSNSAIDAAGASSDVILQATTLLEVTAGASIDVANGLTMQSGGNLLVNDSLIAGHDIVLAAGTADPNGVMTLNAPVDSLDGGVLLSTGSSGLLSPNTGSIVINAAVTANSLGGFATPDTGAISLRTDGLKFGPGGTLASPYYGSVDLAPATPGLSMTVGGSVAATGQGLNVADLPVARGRYGSEPSLVLGASVTNTGTGVMTTTAGAITLAGSIYEGGLHGVRLTLDSIGPVTQTAPLIGVGTLSGSTGAVDLTNPSNQIRTIGQFTANGDFALDSVASQSYGGSGLSGVVILYGGISATNISLTVPAAGGIIELGGGEGGLVTLVVPQGGRISLEADNISIAPPFNFGTYAFGARIIAPGGVVALAPFTPGDGVVFAEPGTTIAAGLLIPAADLLAIQPGIGTLQVGLPVGQTVPTAGSITVGESLDLTTLAATLALDTTGPITQATGATIAVGSLTGTADTVTLDQANAIGTLGAFAASGSLTLNDATSLTVAGPIVAGDVSLTAAGTMTLAGDILPALSPTDVRLQVASDPNGGASFVQTGTVTVGGAAANSGTLAIALPGSGAVSLAGLQAPGLQLVLSLGTGTAAGTLAAGGLLVEGQAGSATLFGSVAGNATPGAALISHIIPQVDPAYTMNGCVIGATFCALLPIVPPPIVQGPSLVQAGFTASFGSLRQQLPGWMPPVPALQTPAISVLGIPPVLPDQLTSPDVVPPNIASVDY